MTMEITEILLSAQSLDGQVRLAAEETLKQFQEQNLPHYLLSLSVELSNDQKPPESRRLAGIILKNSLDTKDSNRKEELAQGWVSVDFFIKAQIKDSLLQTLGSSLMEARHTSSQVIAKIAYIEIPRQQWQNLIERLLNNMKQQAAPAALKQATLEALGYVCEEISYQDLEQEQSNAVITAVVQGMSQQEHSCEVRLAAVRSLYNALDFAKSNFRNEVSRNYIMQVVCEAAIAKELEIRQAAFECIVSIASMYYDFLQPYMDTLFALTANAVKGDEEPVALQAIEFWSAICDKENEIKETYDDAEGNSKVPCSHFIQKALPLLGPMLLETLLKQEEDQDLDDATWNLSIAGGNCLGLVARTVRDAIVPLVFPFVQDNITKPEWRNREAATSAIGYILEGPSVEILSPFVRSVLEYLLKAMEDQNSHVKDTTAWTLVRIFEIVHSRNSDYPVITAEKFPHIITVLMRSICDANVSEKVCGAIYFLAKAYEDAKSDSSLLTPYLGNIISALLATADRMDTNSVTLRAAAYETLNEIVWCSQVPETSNMIDQLLFEIMNRLSNTIELQITSSDDREKRSELRALLCGVLQVIVQKLSGHDETKFIILESADPMMDLFIKVLDCARDFGHEEAILDCGRDTGHEEAMLAVGSLAYAMGPEFNKYLPAFYEYLYWGLLNFEEHQFFSISVGVVGDICRALDYNILPFCDGIMDILFVHLSKSVLHQSLRPLIFSCFGDVALAIGKEPFKRYIGRVLDALHAAAEEHCVALDPSDEDMLEYGIQLMRGIFEACSGILQECESCWKAQFMSLYATHLLQFNKAMFGEKDNTVFRDKAYNKHFGKHIACVLEMLQGAAEHCVTLYSSDEYKLESGNPIRKSISKFGNLLRRCIFETYSGILQSFKISKTQMTSPHVTQLLRFTKAVLRDENTDEWATKAAVAAMVDLADNLGKMEPLVQSCKRELDVLGGRVQSGQMSDVDELKETSITIGWLLLSLMTASEIPFA